MLAIFVALFFSGCVDFSASTTHFGVLVSQCSNGTRTVTVTPKINGNSRSLVFLGQTLSRMDKAGNIAEGFGTRFTSSGFPAVVSFYSNVGYSRTHNRGECRMNAEYVYAVFQNGKETCFDANRFPRIHGIVGIAWDTINKSAEKRLKNDVWDDSLEGRWQTLFDPDLWIRVQNSAAPLASR